MCIAKEAKSKAYKVELGLNVRSFQLLVCMFHYYISEAPVITKFEAPKVADLFSKVQLKCASKGNPEPDIGITFNGQPAEKASGVTVISGSSEKMIEFKAERDSEIWCEASNEVGRDKRKIRIAVDREFWSFVFIFIQLVFERV